MRPCAGLLVVILCGGLCVAEDVKLFTPEEAAKMVGKTCTIEMVVKAAGRTKAGDIYFLNSQEDRTAPNNFTVMIGKSAVTQLKEQKIEDPRAYYQGKTIRVKGTVKLYKDKPEIIVNDVEQLKVIEKK